MSLPSYKKCISIHSFHGFIYFFAPLPYSNDDSLLATSQFMYIAHRRGSWNYILGNTLSANKWDIEGDPVGKEIMILLSAKNSCCEAKIEKLRMQTRLKQWRENYNVT